MVERTELGNRMKDNYENAYRLFLPKRSNVIIRVDGKAFHTLTRGIEKPFDTEFMHAMELTALELCKEIQGAKLAYVQSDEISIWVTDYDDLKTCAWFDNNLQKLCSISAATASVEFTWQYGKKGLFDSRVFVIPELEEVCNYFIWRQKDAERNSINMLAQSHFSPKQLHGKTIPQVHDMLHGIGVNWSDLSVNKKRGMCVVDKNLTEPPIFTQDREFIKSRVKQF